MSIRKKKEEPKPIDVVLDAVAVVAKGEIEEVWVPDAAQLPRIQAPLVRGASKRDFALDLRINLILAAPKTSARKDRG